MMTPPTNHPNQPESYVLEYRHRGVSAAPPVGPREWVKVSIALGTLSWVTLGFLCAGATSRAAFLPLSLAAGGLATGVFGATGALPRDATAGALCAIFMSFTVLAIWLLALVLF
jgi:hypothetical protein